MYILLRIKVFIESNLNIVGYNTKKNPKSDKHEICHNLDYSYYINVMPLMTKMPVIHPFKKHKFDIIRKLNDKTISNIEYQELIEEFYRKPTKRLLTLSWERDRVAA